MYERHPLIRVLTSAHIGEDIERSQKCDVFHLGKSVTGAEWKVLISNLNETTSAQNAANLSKVITGAYLNGWG
jgi:hypothetical protein